MQADFWHKKWEKNEIGFHQSQANPLLTGYLHTLTLPKNSRVFLPFCGKTLDIHWLLSQNYRVVGAELSQLAVEQLFAELGVTPDITPLGALKRYSAEGIDIFVGDFFELTADAVGPVDAVYDRAALVALPDTMRGGYAAHLMQVSKRARQLLVTYVYDQSLLEGPPFSVSRQDVERYYAQAYDLQLLATVEVEGGFRGKIPALENVWLLGHK